MRKELTSNLLHILCRPIQISVLLNFSSLGSFLQNTSNQCFSVCVFMAIMALSVDEFVSFLAAERK